MSPYSETYSGTPLATCSSPSQRTDPLALDQALQQLASDKEACGNLKDRQWELTKDRQRLRLLLADSVSLQGRLVSLADNLREKMWAGDLQSWTLHSGDRAAPPKWLQPDIMPVGNVEDGGDSEEDDVGMLWSDSDTGSTVDSHLWSSHSVHNLPLAAAADVSCDAYAPPIGTDVPSPGHRGATQTVDLSRFMGVLLETPTEAADTTDTPGKVAACSSPASAAPEISRAAPDGDSTRPGKYLLQAVCGASDVSFWAEQEHEVWPGDSIFTDSILRSRGVAASQMVQVSVLSVLQQLGFFSQSKLALLLGLGVETLVMSYVC